MTQLRSITCLLALLWNIRQTASELSCYYPDGSLSQSHKPCNATADSPPYTVSACCAEDDFCLDNGLCLEHGTLRRGTCTSRNWESPCAPYCQKENPDDAAYLSSCHDHNYTCGSGLLAQCNETSSFMIPGGYGILLRPTQIGADQAFQLSPYSTLRVQDANSSSSSSSATTTTAPPSSITATTTATCPSREDDGLFTFTAGTLAAGVVGIGGPLLLALAGAIVMILRLRRQMLESQTTGGSPQYIMHVTPSHSAPAPPSKPMKARTGRPNVSSTWPNTQLPGSLGA